MNRLLHRLAQWWRSIRWRYFTDQSAWHLTCADLNQRMAEEVWLGKGKSQRQRKSETHS